MPGCVTSSSNGIYRFRVAFSEGQFGWRDVTTSELKSLGLGSKQVADLTEKIKAANLTFAAPDWSLERAAEAMIRGGFRHLVVVDGGETVGILSMRDIVRCWTDVGASCDVPEPARA